jgi:PAS domain S-box-containing protein
LYAGDRLIRRLYINNLLQQVGPVADLAAKVIDERLMDTQASLQSFATDPGVHDAWTRTDLPSAMAHLQEAHELRQEIASWAIYDTKGFLWASYPKTASQTKESFAGSIWFKRVTQTRGAYVSGVSRNETPAHGLAVTVAVPIMDRQQISGVLTATYDLDTIKSWLTGMSLSATKWISVVDQNGLMVVAPDSSSPNLARDVSAHQNVKKVMAGQGGTEFLWQDGKHLLASRHPLSSLGWGVLVEIPMEEIDKAIWKAERPLGLIGLLFLALALAIGSAGVLLYSRLRESREHVRQIVTTATDAFIAINDRGLITDWNPQAEALFGWSETEVVGQPLHDTIIPPSYREAHLRGLKHFLATGEGPVLNKTLELTALDRSGREFPVELSISPVRDRGRNSFNAFVRDISERKQAEQEIAKLNSELRGRVSELEGRNKELEAFSYSVSHDVAAPLRHIAGFSQLLLEDCKEQLTPDGCEYLQEIQHSTHRMQQLVEDLLRFSRLGAQGLKLQMTNLDEVVGEVVSDLQRDLAGRKVTFEISHLPSAECDRSLIKQVFVNLISNAVKFTSTRDHAVIAVGERHQDGESILFVRDNGVGFDMKHADQLFGPFQRLHTQEEFEGTGVGLATVRRIIAKHQGRIWADAKPDQGASFFFSLTPDALAETATSAHP